MTDNPIKKARKSLDNVMTDEELDEVMDLLREAEEGMGEYGIHGMPEELDRAWRRGKVHVVSYEYTPARSRDFSKFYAELSCTVEDEEFHV